MEYSEINRVGRSIEKASSEIQHKHLVIIISSLEKRIAELEKEKRLGFPMTDAVGKWNELRKENPLDWCKDINGKPLNPYHLNTATI